MSKKKTDARSADVIIGRPWGVDHVSSRSLSGKVRRMFAHSTQNWWWTAHPAAH
ncbi:trp operon leader peptide [Streptomyces sp. NPDC057474]|uniref:trp operon leader peptide n=1 Tax=Streptomyces sp. NPDC057474 TaxID=3346144 RepID=UPI00367B37CA